MSPSFSNCWLWQDDTMLPCAHGVSLYDRGFRYGQHLFETMAVREGRLLFFEEHWRSLQAAAERQGFPFLQEWHHGLARFLKKTVFEDGLLRFYLTAGEGALGSPMVAPQLLAFWEKCDFPSEGQIKKGINILALDAPVGTRLWGEKTGNYWEHLRALETARQQGAEEGLIFDAEGYLISAVMANVILRLEDGTLMTPAPCRGARKGVMLGWVRQQLPELIEANIHRNDLKRAVALWLTNARLGVMPVVKIDERVFQKLYFSLSLGNL